MADEDIVITEPSNEHPLQQNYVPGPKGAYELKKTENGIYIRVDMPGAIQRSVHVDKDRDNTRHEIHFRGVSIKKVEWPFDDSLRFYIGTIKVECQDFEQVLVNHEVNNGTCRIFISGVDNAYLTFRTPKNSGSSKPAVVYENHLNPDSARIEGVQNFVMHDPNCRCCNGRNGDRTLNGPWSEGGGHINPFIYRGVKGVFETKFNRVGDDYYMYFRLDMPDCSKNHYIVDTYTNHIVVFGQRDSTAECILDDDGGRRYCCRISLKCNCCSFDIARMCNMHKLRDGVLSLLVKINGNNNLVIKEDPSAPGDRLRLERPYSEPSPTSDDQCSSTASNKMPHTRNHQRQRHRRRRRANK